MGGESRTPTETLMKCLEDFGLDEPLAVVVIYQTQGGDLAWSQSSNRHSDFIGMLEMAKFWYLEERKNDQAG